MDVATIAKVCHEVNRAYCQSIGDFSQPSWAAAPDWQQDSAIAGVNYQLDYPAATPEDMHAAWKEIKRQNGWVYGPVKNPETKEHPCFVEYSELPAAQRAKDYLFQAVVKALSY